MRKRYDKAFKAKIAIEALRGEKTLQELGTAYDVHPNMIALWKKQLLGSAEQLFEKQGRTRTRKRPRERRICFSSRSASSRSRTSS